MDETEAKINNEREYIDLGLPNPKKVQKNFIQQGKSPMGY